MAFFDDITKKISKAGQDALGKAKDMADIAKLNSSISDEEKKINNTYFQIGKLYVQLHSTDFEENFAVLFNNLEESNRKIVDLKEKLQELRNVIRCPNCGAEVSADSAFCSACAAKLPNQKSADYQNLAKCSSCGAFVNKNMRFCTTCGAQMSAPKVEEQPAPAEEAVVTNEEPEVKANPVCPNCGAELEADSVFCAECGTKV